jgi:hypothetical protein
VATYIYTWQKNAKENHPLEDDLPVKSNKTWRDSQPKCKMEINPEHLGH